MRTLLLAIVLGFYSLALLTAISADSAQRIAFADADVSNVSRIEVKSGREKNRDVYEIEFRADGNEYSYKVAVDNGDILKKSIKEGKISKIDSSEAEDIALKHAGLKRAGVLYLKTEVKGGVYVVTFTSKGYDYKYEIGSKGSVLSWKRSEVSKKK